MLWLLLLLFFREACPFAISKGPIPQLLKSAGSRGLKWTVPLYATTSAPLKFDCEIETQIVQVEQDKDLRLRISRFTVIARATASTASTKRSDRTVPRCATLNVMPKDRVASSFVLVKLLIANVVSTNAYSCCQIFIWTIHILIFSSWPVLLVVCRSFGAENSEAKDTLGRSKECCELRF